MKKPRLILHHIAFTGPDVEVARLDFEKRPNFIYGASNTGKSFVLNAINFMLGATATALPDIPERRPYDTAWLGLTFPTGRQVTLSRSTKGGDFLLHSGLREAPDPHETPTVLGAVHRAEKFDTLSHLLLSEVGLASKRIAKNKAGRTENFTFRQVAPYVLVDETSIQEPRSPVESGQRDETRERSAFRLLLTGQDDSSVIVSMTAPVFKASKTAKIATVNELIAALDANIIAASAAPDGDDSTLLTLEARLSEARLMWEGAQQSLRNHLDRRRQFAASIDELRDRSDDIAIHLERFAQLDSVYVSDIARLEAVEEAGFLLTLGKERNCSLCGAPPEAQTKSHGIETIEEIRTSAIAEIAKIKQMRSDLEITVSDLKAELEALGPQIQEAQADLAAIEQEIKRLSPAAREYQQTLSQLITRRDAANRLAQLVEQKNALLTKREEYEKLKQSRKDQPQLKAPGAALHDFCMIVSSILEAWKFPGGHRVSFDEGTYDISIDGKLRSANGKGVRALTHAAFKIGLLLYCRRNNLAHPGFLVLDSPLVAYRDPVRSMKGALEPGEQEIAASPVREHFFKHLASLANEAQFIILDNIDPPADIDRHTKTQLFTGSPNEGRFGFFPISHHQRSATRPDS